MSGQMLLPSSVILKLINLHKYWLFYLYMWVLSGSSLSQDAANKPPGDTDDSISDGQRVVIDPSLWAERKCRPGLQGGGVCPAGLLPEHDRQELSLKTTI